MTPHWAMLAIVAGFTVTLGACDRSTPTASTAPAAPSTMQSVEDHLKTAGHEIKQAAKDVGQDVQPALNRAKEEGREVIHNGAQKIADMTATQPAQPATATQP